MLNVHFGEIDGAEVHPAEFLSVCQSVGCALKSICLCTGLFSWHKIKKNHLMILKGLSIHDRVQTANHVDSTLLNYEFKESCIPKIKIGNSWSCLFHSVGILEEFLNNSKPDISNGFGYSFPIVKELFKNSTCNIKLLKEYRSFISR